MRISTPAGSVLRLGLAAAMLWAGAAGLALGQAPAEAGASAAALQGAAGFRLSAVRLRGVQALPESELQQLAQPYLGRSVDLPDLQALAAAITEHYKSRGYFLAEAVVPVQTVQDGIVEISVVEGRLGRIDVEVAPDAPITEARVLSFLQRLPVGQAVQADRYERVMLLLSDLPGIKVTSGLQQGVEPGTVDLAVEVVPARRWSFVAEADNHGTREIGRYRLGGSVRMASPLGLGDNLDARLLVSNSDLAYGRLAYELPLGGSGLRLGAGLAHVQYQVGGAFRPLDAHGEADVLDVSLSYPFVRQRNHNLQGRLVFESKRLRDDYRAVNFKFSKRVQDVGLGWTWDRRDNFFGGGYFASSGTFYSGRLRLNNADVRAADQGPGGLRTHGSFNKLVASVSRLQSIFPRHSLYYSVGGQWANSNLDASEKLVLGGARAVRAYPSSEAMVDQGWIQTVEWRWAATDELTPFVFFDAAHGQLFKRPPTGFGRNGVSLRGAGLGLYWGRQGDFSINTTLAWRVGTPRSATDGGGHNPRLFIQAQKVF